MQEGNKDRLFGWLIQASILVFLLILAIFWVENRGLDILGWHKNANIKACEFLGGDSDLGATLVKMSNQAEGRLKMDIDGYLKFQQSKTFTANSAEEAKDSLAAVMRTCSDLLSDVPINK